MHVPLYAAARRKKYLGPPFDGHLTRTRIEEILGEAFAPSKDLTERLRTWIHDVLGKKTAGEVFAGVDQSKWVFATLPAKAPSLAWSDHEIRETIADYLSMLRSELAGKPYNKTVHRNALLKHLPSP